MTLTLTFLALTFSAMNKYKIEISARRDPIINNLVYRGQGLFGDKGGTGMVPIHKSSLCAGRSLDTHLIYCGKMAMLGRMRRTDTWTHFTFEVKKNKILCKLCKTQQT